MTLGGCITGEPLVVRPLGPQSPFDGVLESSRTLLGVKDSRDTVGNDSGDERKSRHFTPSITEGPPAKTLNFVTPTLSRIVSQTVYFRRVSTNEDLDFPRSYA